VPFASARDLRLTNTYKSAHPVRLAETCDGLHIPFRTRRTNQHVIKGSCVVLRNLYRFRAEISYKRVEHMCGPNWTLL
jgi:hypothetical protein